MIKIIANVPVATDSWDHISPRGTAINSTTNPNFNAKLFKLIPAQDIRVLDLGCAGGGFVESVINAGGFAVGIEGSDYSRKIGRAAWGTIPDNLFTADIRYPFQILVNKAPAKFNVITLWAIFEHIQEEHLEGVIKNILKHLDKDGMIVGSVGLATEGKYHVTVKSQEWWIETWAKYGLVVDEDLWEFIAPDWLRCDASFAMCLRRNNG